jgi:uncharacterized cupredoxin-like copper-binding protein
MLMQRTISGEAVWDGEAQVYYSKSDIEGLHPASIADRGAGKAGRGLTCIKALTGGGAKLIPLASPASHQPREAVMTRIKCRAPFFLALALLAAGASAALADATVNVSLRDTGGAMDLSKNMMMGMGMKADMKNAPMSIVLDKKAVPAGKVTFDVKNDSKDMVHEMLVSPVAGQSAVLAYVDTENRVDEEKSGDLGEVSELDPGKAGALTLELKPGLYLLYCNVPGHYMAGMWATLTVK